MTMQELVKYIQVKENSQNLDRLELEDNKSSKALVVDHGSLSGSKYSSLFVYRHDNQMMILLLYIDDIILTGNNNALLDEFTADLGRMFSMKDLGPLHFFLGIQVNRTPDGLFLHQSKFAGDLLQRAIMVDSKPIANPMAPKSFSLKKEILSSMTQLCFGTLLAAFNISL
ncbi:hypothetical protein RJ639_006418 [Escallonia herrerae]|uniref:Reverse transcriptase Ty1/copia-type domain-containing protein n=1 Tax=Escallonia herrerae TaxID=1293975 RepID=A0AA88W1C2_9ASTE|nr:hypothetical protein RJ639_006418 [Escallonia herrerae]